MTTPSHHSRSNLLGLLEVPLRWVHPPPTPGGWGLLPAGGTERWQGVWGAPRGPGQDPTPRANHRDGRAPRAQARMVALGSSFVPPPTSQRWRRMDCSGGVTARTALCLHPGMRRAAPWEAGSRGRAGGPGRSAGVGQAGPRSSGLPLSVAFSVGLSWGVNVTHSQGHGRGLQAQPRVPPSPCTGSGRPASLPTPLLG